MSLTSKLRVILQSKSKWQFYNLPNRTLTQRIREKPKKRIFVKGILPVFTGVAVVLYGRWYYLSTSLPPIESDQSLERPTNFEISIYTFLPFRILSRIWGYCCRIELPIFLREPIIGLYVKTFDVDMCEYCCQDLTEYKSLSDFFIRPIKLENRPVDSSAGCLTSPADGKILSFTLIDQDEIKQDRDQTYSLQKFLGEHNWFEKIEQEETLVNNLPESCMLNMGKENTTQVMSRAPAVSSVSESQLVPECDYINDLKQNPDSDLYEVVVYLAPGDYHRFHSPVTWDVHFRRHFTGKLLSVSPTVATFVHNLFAINERAVYIGKWKHGFFSMTAVGATNVGSIGVVFDPTLHTNSAFAKQTPRDIYFYTKTTDKASQPTEKVTTDLYRGTKINKGDPFGEFRFGSTIVLIFEAPKNFKFNISENQKIKFGEKIGYVE